MPVNVRGTIVSMARETRLVSVRYICILQAKYGNLSEVFDHPLPKPTSPFLPYPDPKFCPSSPLLVKLFCIWKGRLEMGTDAVQGTFNQPRGVICWRLWRNGIPERAMAAVDAVC